MSVNITHMKWVFLLLVFALFIVFAFPQELQIETESTSCYDCSDQVIETRGFGSGSVGGGGNVE